MRPIDFMNPNILLLPILVLGMQSCDSGSTPATGGGTSPPYVSAPDCVGAGNIIAEEAAAPFNATYVRVQHIGDRGTAELGGEVANRVTWRVGEFTGLFPPESTVGDFQRGYRDDPPPVSASAFQLWCNGAGFFINTWQFGHAIALVGEGPSVSIARDLSPAPAPFRDSGSALTLEAAIDVRHANYQAPHVGDGTAQVSFYYYVQDRTSGVVLAHLIILFDSRPFGVGGSGVESVGSDGHNAFVSSPLRETDATGAPVRFVRALPQSAPMRVVTPWARPDLFRAQVTRDMFGALLARLKAGPLPAISAGPEDYDVLSFGVLAEVFPGTGGEHNLSFGGSVLDLRLSGS
ncbi:MAG: hypothetical protein IPP91_08045 [Betaproteobacteria bacterium]|nr:hypothetical protein [Betaproteobacteria bacterium]